MNNIFVHNFVLSKVILVDGRKSVYVDVIGTTISFLTSFTYKEPVLLLGWGTIEYLVEYLAPKLFLLRLYVNLTSLLYLLLSFIRLNN